MMKTRGGAKQRKKHEEVFQYHRNQGNVGLKLLEKTRLGEGERARGRKKQVWEATGLQRSFCKKGGGDPDRGQFVAVDVD